MKNRSGTKYERSQVSHLYRHIEHGVYYARGRNAAGKDTWRSLDTTSFSVAKARLAGKLAEIQAGKNLSSGHWLRSLQTVSQAADVYRGRVKADISLKPSMVLYRLQTIDALFRSWPQLADRRLSSITTDECRCWAKDYQPQVSPNRFNNTVGSLRHIFAIAAEAGAIVENPAAAIGKVKVTAKKLELPSRKQFHAIVTAIRNTGSGWAHPAADLVEFLAYSGCRITEAAYITWKDVGGKAGAIRIHGHEETGTKNTESRSIPITPPMRDLLDRLSRRDYEPRNPERRGKDFIVYVTECREALANACKKVGVKLLTHHDLRHLFATRCIEAGVDIPTVSRWLGHKDGGALAMKTYGHLRDEHSQAMAAKVSF